MTTSQVVNEETAKIRADRDRWKVLAGELAEAVSGFLSYSTSHCDCGHPACKLCDRTNYAKQALTAYTKLVGGE